MLRTGACTEEKINIQRMILICQRIISISAGTLTGLSIGENQLVPIPKLLSRNTFIATELKNNLIKAACTAQRLENACAIALEHIPNPTYKNIRLILEAGQDEMISKENEDDTSIQEHAIVRGADYYRRK